MTSSEREYVERTKREERERHSKARAEGCPRGWEDEWERSGKFQMMVRSGRH